jgi:hypothetical protein
MTKFSTDPHVIVLGEINVKAEARMRQLAADLFWSCESGEWGYSQMRSVSVLACPAESLRSDQLFVRPVAELAALINKLMVKYFGIHKDVLERFETYLRASQGAAADAVACLKRAVGDVLRELHLAPSILLTSLSELFRWLRGEITLAAAALSIGVRWGLKTVALWGARALAVLIGSNFIVASLFIVGAVLVARQLARAVLGF